MTLSPSGRMGGSEPIREDWGTLNTSGRMGDFEPIREDGGGL